MTPNNAEIALDPFIIFRYDLFCSQSTIMKYLKKWHHVLFKGILSTKIVIFSYPKLLSFFHTDLHKMKINTELCCKRYDFLTKKTIVIGIIVQDNKNSNLFIWPSMWTPSWACTLFRNNKHHVVLGQKRKCQRVEESGLWRIQRERWIEVKYLPNGTNAGYK